MKTEKTLLGFLLDTLFYYIFTFVFLYWKKYTF